MANRSVDLEYLYSIQEIEEIIKIPKEKRTFTNTCHHLADVQGELYNKSKAFIFPHLVGISKELRDAASEAKKLYEGYEIEYFQRKDIYEALVEFKSLVSVQEYLIFFERLFEQLSPSAPSSC